MSLRVIFFIFVLTTGLLAAPSADSLLKKRGFGWKTVSTANMRLHYESGGFAEVRIDTIAARQEKSFARNLSLLGLDRYENKIDIFIVGSRERMKLLTGESTNGVAYPASHVIAFVFSDKADASGAHELMHVMVVNTWGKGGKVWMNEGFAGYADDIWHGYPLHGLANCLRKQNKLIALEKLISDFRKHDDLITYPQSASLVKFIYETYGYEKFKALRQEGTARSFKKILGKTAADIEADWIASISTKDTTGIRYQIGQ